MKLVDSHCHLDSLDLTLYNNNLCNVIDAAYAVGVSHMLCVATRWDNIPTVIKIAEGYSAVSAAVGIHPTEEGPKDLTVEQLMDVAAHPKVVAIGETGLDYYHPQSDLYNQQQQFRIHIRAARQLKKPLVIHTREAKDDTIAILKAESAADVGGVMHCFTEDWAMAQEAIKLNFYISFSGIVTFKNAVQLKEVAKKVPLDKMLLETDAPYLAPVPYRGKQNQPAYVRHIAEYIAELRNIPLEVLAEQTTKNFFDLFYSP